MESDFALNSHMYFDFTTPKGLKITPSDEKKTRKTNRERSPNREVKRLEEKKTAIPSNVNFFNTVFINQDINIQLFFGSNIMAS